MVEQVCHGAGRQFHVGEADTLDDADALAVASLHQPLFHVVVEAHHVHGALDVGQVGVEGVGMRTDVDEDVGPLAQFPLLPFFLLVVDAALDFIGGEVLHFGQADVYQLLQVLLAQLLVLLAVAPAQVDIHAHGQHQDEKRQAAQQYYTVGYPYYPGVSGKQVLVEIIIVNRHVPAPQIVGVT